MTASKWTFVRTHTARRSAATNLAMGGATLDFICKLGGWKKLETLEKYLLATRMEVAKVVAEYDFFFRLGSIETKNILYCPLKRKYTEEKQNKQFFQSKLFVNQVTLKTKVHAKNVAFITLVGC